MFCGSAEDFLFALYAGVVAITLTHEQRFIMGFSKEPIERNVQYCH